MSRPLLAFFGHHKCGTTWMSSVLREACERLDLRFVEAHNAQPFAGDLPAWLARERVDFLAYTNASPHHVAPLFATPLEVRAFHLIRDPRDLLVSGYFSSRYSHPTEHWPELSAHRRRLESVSPEEGLLLEMAFERHVVDHIGGWDYHRPEVLEMRLEDFFADEQRAFGRVFEHLGLLASGRLDVATVADIVHRNSFAVRTAGREPGQEDPKSHLRKGKAGDWVNHFGAAHKARFEADHPGLLARLGYAADDSW